MQAFGGGRILTFYSFKGGVGRSMALANIACLLAQEGKRVLIVDWDLEAPGLEHFFLPHDKGLSARLAKAPGVIDLLQASRPDWRACVVPIEAKGARLDIMHSGKASRETSAYTSAVQQLNWRELYTDEETLIGNYFDEVRRDWKEEYDYVLLDSRTGVTDIGDLCTVILPDQLVMLFVTNEQNVEGVSSMYRRALEAHESLPAERERLLALPILSRDEFYSEYDKSTAWRERAAERLAPLFADWLPRDVRPIDAFQKIFIPYFAIWSFGEALPVLERPEAISNPASINAAYSRIAALIEGEMDWSVLARFTDLGEAAARAGREKEEAVAEERRRGRRTAMSVAAAVVVALGFAGAAYDWLTSQQAAEQAALSEEQAARVAELNSSILARNAELRDAQDATLAAEERARALEAQLGERDRRLADLQAAEEELAVLRTRAQDQISASAAVSAIRDKEIEEQAREIEGLRTEVEALSLQLAAANEELDALKAELGASGGAVQALDQLNAQIAAARAEAADARAEAQDLRRRLALAETERDGLRGQQAVLNQTLEALNATVSDSRGASAQSQREVDLLRSELASLQARYDALSTRYQRLLEDLASPLQRIPLKKSP